MCSAHRLFFFEKHFYKIFWLKLTEISYIPLDKIEKMRYPKRNKGRKCPKYLIEGSRTLWKENLRESTIWSN